MIRTEHLQCPHYNAIASSRRMYEIKMMLQLMSHQLDMCHLVTHAPLMQTNSNDRFFSFTRYTKKVDVLYMIECIHVGLRYKSTSIGDCHFFAFTLVRIVP